MDTNLISKPTNNNSYIVAVVIMFLISVGLVLGILMLRPMADLLVVIGAVSAITAPTTGGLLAFMKSQETHLSVNSRLDEWKASMKVEERRAGSDSAIASAAAGTGPPAIAPVPNVIEAPPTAKGQ